MQAGKTYYTGELAKKYYTVKSFGKTWKVHYWILDTQKLSCYQSDRVRIFFVFMKIFADFFF